MTRRSGDKYTAPERADLSAEEAPEDARQPPDAPVAFDPAFAAGAAIAVAVFACILLAPLAYRLYDTDAPSAADRLATLTGLALLIVGVSLLLLSVYAALLEVRARLGPPAKRPAAARTAGEPLTAGPPPLAGVIGRSRALIVLLLLVACVPLLAAAWVAQSRADGESAAVATATPRTATRTPSPGPAATPAP